MAISHLLAANEIETEQAGVELSHKVSQGDVIFFYGELGAGKTTMIRGLLKGLGYQGTVRSPTFTLFQLYDADQLVLHADLYRVDSGEGLGLDDYLGTRTCLIEWPDRLAGSVDERIGWRVSITILEQGRLIAINPPERVPV